MRWLVGLTVLASLGFAVLILFSRAAPSFNLPQSNLLRSFFTHEPPPTVLTLVLAGDTGLNSSGAYVSSYGPWVETTQLIAPQIDGDLNFANLETVVTDRNDLVAEPKLFTFRTHPDAVRHLLRMGVNVVSAANNHAMDFGVAGARETVRNLSGMLGDGLIAYAGLGLNRDEAAAPRVFDLKGQRIAFSAIGIASLGTADENTPGQLAYQTDRDFSDVVARLAAAPAAYRILSVHHGAEFEPKTSGDDRRHMRDEAVRDAGVDLVIGHHQHVVAGVEMVGGKLVFYGLGNFLHLGTQDMAAFDICRDYGLIARIHLAVVDRTFSLRAIEAIPIRGMHRQPVPYRGEAGAARIHVLNHLAAALDDPASGGEGVRFAPQADGSGLYCAPGAEYDAGRVGTLCANALPAREPAPELRARIANACATTVMRSIAKTDVPLGASFEAGSP